MEQKELIDVLSNMTVKQLADLAGALEEEWGVTAAAAVAVAAGPGAGGGAGGDAPAEEQTEFDVILKDFGAKKIGVIKVVRGITGLGLKEAKDLVESAPGAVKEGVSKDEAADILKQLEEAGAAAEIK